VIALRRNEAARVLAEVAHRSLEVCASTEPHIQQLKLRATTALECELIEALGKAVDAQRSLSEIVASLAGRVDGGQS